MSGFSFLFGQIWMSLFAALAMGVVFGWLVWGRRMADLQAEFEAQKYNVKEKKARIAALEENLRFERSKTSDGNRDIASSG